MLEALKKQLNKAYTENGAVTNASTGSDCLNLFSSIGALRTASAGEITVRFLRAYAEDPTLAMKTAFYARDVREGLGERRVFRVIMKYAAANMPGAAFKNMEHIAEYGRYDDLMVFIGTPLEPQMLGLVKRQLMQDVLAMKTCSGSVSLLAKWMPSMNASSERTKQHARKIMEALGLSEREYRQMLSGLRARLSIIENSLRQRDYTFDYEKQASKAMLKYRGAFFRNDELRYREYLAAVSKGEKRMHTEVLSPYDIVRPMFRSKVHWSWFYEGRHYDTMMRLSHVDEKDRLALDAAWNALPDYTEGENALCVVDGSGSMYLQADPLPAAIAQSLGIYFAEKNSGPFKNHFITFSEKPQLVEIRGADIYEKVRYSYSFQDPTNTNVQKVFEEILLAAWENNVRPKDMPKSIYIISDLEFDRCTEDAGLTNFEYAKKLFAESGYTLPQVVFWNVSSRNAQYPVTKNEQGAILVSGSSAKVFGSLACNKTTPYEYMLSVLTGERYRPIAV